jgi:hypothetical protein
MTSENGMSQRAFAALAGVSQPGIVKALRRGLLDVKKNGKNNPDGPRSRAWLDNRQPQVIGQPDNVSPACAERSASLVARECELAG